MMNKPFGDGKSYSDTKIGNDEYLYLKKTSSSEFLNY